jgi:hypothetical protein
MNPVNADRVIKQMKEKDESLESSKRKTMTIPD